MGSLLLETPEKKHPLLKPSEVSVHVVPAGAFSIEPIHIQFIQDFPTSPTELCQFFGMAQICSHLIT